MLEDTQNLLTKLARKKVKMDQTSLVLFEKSYLKLQICSDIISECPQGTFSSQFHVSLINTTVIVHDYV